MIIDRRDLMNMLRHAYLFGINEGLNKEYPYLTEEGEKDLDSLIEDYGESGYESFGDDLGSMNDKPITMKKTTEIVNLLEKSMQVEIDIELACDIARIIIND